MKSTRARFPGLLHPLVVGILLLSLWVAAGAEAQATRAEPVTGAGVTTIGGIATNARVNIRGGPAAMFPVTGTLPYGTRVTKGMCLGGGSARWCEVKTMDGKVSGFVSARFLVEGGARPPAVTDDGGPDFYAVRGLSGNERLGVRVEPNASSAVLATLRQGEVVRNLGCRSAGASRWCRIRSTTGMDVTGWVNGRYLQESAAPARPPVSPNKPGPGASGPDFYVVTGLAAGDFLNVRSQASTKGTILARLAQGARVQNLGCQQSGQSRWCRIRTTGGVEVIGWVSGRFLREG